MLSLRVKIWCFIYFFLVHNMSSIPTVVDNFSFTIYISNRLLIYIITMQAVLLFLQDECLKSDATNIFRHRLLCGKCGPILYHFLFACVWLIYFKVAQSIFGLILCPKIDVLPMKVCVWYYQMGPITLLFSHTLLFLALTIFPFLLQILYFILFIYLLWKM